VNPNDPEKVILGTLVLTAAVVTWRGVRSGTLSPRTYAALGVVAFLLLGLGTFAPQLAAAFAVLVLVVVLLSSQADLVALSGLSTGAAGSLAARARGGPRVAGGGLTGGVSA